MKKLLVMLLALVFVISMATAAYAYTDTDDLSTVQQDAIYRLTALGVFNGYPNGTFGAKNLITRAEFAKITCVVAGLGDVSSIMANTPSSFSDVGVGLWYTGYINVAASQGYIHGYPDGTFKPNQLIKMSEVVTMLMRVAGYNDNLAGPWPFDYIAEAGKQDVTDDVIFVSNASALRGDVAVMTNNLLDVILVNWDSDISKFVQDEENTTVLADSFNAAIYEDAMFDNDAAIDDGVDGWVYSDLSDNEIEMSIYLYNKDDDEYEDNATSLIMNENCYFAGGMGLTDIGGMEADIIVNDDEEVIYVKLTSMVAYSDDMEGSISEEDLKVDGESVDVTTDAPWYSIADFDTTESDSAKIFYNTDGDVYAVADLSNTEQFGSQVILADSYDKDKETLEELDGESFDLEDQDFAVLKDGKVINASDIEQKDVVYILEPANGDADYILLVEDMVEGTLDEGADKTITVDDNDYNFDASGYPSYYNSEGGVDGSYESLDSLTDLEDIFDDNVGLALYRSHFDVAYLITITDDDISRHVYGVVTDMTISGLFNKVTDITILNQSGSEVTYDIDNADKILTYNAAGAAANTNNSDIDLGSYVEVRLDKDGVVSDVDKIVNTRDTSIAGGAYTTAEMDVSGSKIKISGTWYKVTDDTLFFETVTDNGTVYGSYDSEDFDEANLISSDDILDADTISVGEAFIISHDGGTLERLYLVDSDISTGTQSYSFVDRLYTNSSSDYVAMLDGTVAERKSGESYTKNVFYAYAISNDEMDVTRIFATTDSIDQGGLLTHYPNDDSDNYWVMANGDLADSGSATYSLSDITAKVVDKSSDTLALGTDSVTYGYYTITADTVFYEEDSSLDVDTAVKGDIDEDGYVYAISDEDGNLLYLIIIDDVNTLNSASVVASPTTIIESALNGATVTLDLDNAEFDSSLSAANFTLNSAPGDLSITSVSRTDNDTAVVTLAYSGTLTADDTFTITIDSSDLNVDLDLTTGAITVDFVAEP